MEGRRQSEGLFGGFVGRPIRASLAILSLMVVFFALYYYFDHYYATPQPSLLEQQVARMESAVIQDPNNLGARLTLAEFYIAQRRYNSAIEQLEQVLILEERSDRALADMALAYMNLGDKAKAKELFQKVIEIVAPMEMAELTWSLPTAHYWLGRMALEEGNYEASIPDLEKASNLNPIDADSLLALGQAYLAVDRADDAVKVLTKAVSMVPDFAEAFVTLGQAHEARGDTDKAVSAYQQALNWDAGSAEARAGLDRLASGR